MTGLSPGSREGRPWISASAEDAAGSRPPALGVGSTSHGRSWTTGSGRRPAGRVPVGSAAGRLSIAGRLRRGEPGGGVGDERDGVVQGGPAAREFVGVDGGAYGERATRAQAEVPALRGTAGLGGTRQIGVGDEPAAGRGEFALRRVGGRE